MMQRVLLIDGLNLVRRIFEARGATAGAEFVQSCTQSLQRCLADLHPSHAVVIWDSQEPTWRHLLASEYKANRPPTPPELVSALPDLERAFAEIGVASLTVPNYEADDVIATMSVKLKTAEHTEAVIVSTDKMFYPMLLNGAQIYHQFDRQFIQPETVAARYQLGLAQLMDYWALSGDNSNNVKGVPGVGKKTATELLQTHGDIATMLQALPEQTKGALKKVQQHEQTLSRCQQLVQLKTDVELGVNLKDYRLDEA
ncbi:MAG: 5'-3' exonuclease H3TH domain-containing protein [Pseudomonadales bacterium]